MVVEGFGDERYGVEKVVENLADNLLQRGVSVEVITMVIDGAVSNQLEKHLYQVSYWNSTGQIRFHPRQYSEVYSLIDKINPRIVHCHGCMSWLQVSAIQAAKQKGIPTLISSHGMLEPWMWQQKGKIYYWLKQTYWSLLLKVVIKQADWFHAITWPEGETLKHQFPGVSPIRISNAIDLNEYPTAQVEPDESRYMLFLGRLHPVKGVELILNAFSKTKLDGMRLIVAGPDFNPSYSDTLKKLAFESFEEGVVSFIGSVVGEQKETLLKKSWCTVVPSYSEVIAMVNLESAASYTPTITTNATGLSDWEDGGGLLIDPKVDELSSALNKVASWSLAERMERGIKSRELIEQRYSWDVIGEQWVEAYKTIAEAGKKKHG